MFPSGKSPGVFVVGGRGIPRWLACCSDAVTLSVTEWENLLGHYIQPDEQSHPASVFGKDWVELAGGSASRGLLWKMSTYPCWRKFRFICTPPEYAWLQLRWSPSPAQPQQRAREPLGSQFQQHSFNNTEYKSNKSLYWFTQACGISAEMGMKSYVRKNILCPNKSKRKGRKTGPRWSRWRNHEQASMVGGA